MKIYFKSIALLCFGLPVVLQGTYLTAETVLSQQVRSDNFKGDSVNERLERIALYDKSQVTPKQLVTQALQIIEENYVDGSFNGLNWQQVKTETLSRQYATSEEAYQAIESVLDRLGNPATRFLTPKQFTMFSAENSGKEHIGVGLLEMLSLDYDERPTDAIASKSRSDIEVYPFRDAGALAPFAERRLCPNGCKGTREDDRERLRIITPLPDTPAAEAGLQTGDLLSAIDEVSTDNLSLAEAAMKLRGASGSTVNLTMTRDDSTFDVELKREKIKVENTVRTQLISIDDTKIGYIYLGQFLDSSVPEMKEAIANLKEAKALILDLRNNPGGSVLATVEIAGFFLGEAKIGTAATRVDLPPLNSTQIRLTKQPLVVLVNEGTASAAELLAGSLQDSQRAIIVGTPTVGKGLIHSPKPLADNSGIVVTLGKLFTPNGRDILRSGIEPDILSDATNSPLLDSDIEPASSEDIQYLKAVEQLKMD